MWSLRREWSRAFTTMLLVVLMAGIATFGGVRHLVGQFGGAARQLDKELTTVSSLQNSLMTHETVGHKLLAGRRVDREAYVAEQHQIIAAFQDARQTFRARPESTRVLIEAQSAWQAALTEVGLWDDELPTVRGSLADAQSSFAADSDGARGVLDQLQKPSLAAMRGDLNDAAALERVLMAALAGLFGLALAVTAYFRRRMSRDLVRPVATMHEGVLKLRAGEYSHQLEVARRDELGELAEAFNAMARSLQETHLALTLRATHDSLTGLANRAALSEVLARSFVPGGDRRSQHESVLFIDVDDFKEVNDALGHEAGDDLLVQLAGRLNDCVRPQDLVARLGGDEFAIVVFEDDGGAAGVRVAERILASVRTPCSVGATRMAVTVSIGVAQRGPATANVAELLRQADFAMYMAKGSGKSRYQLFDAQMHDEMVGRSALKTDLALAVARDQLRLDYQPVADLHTGKIVGVEALVRWQHPTRGRLAPAEFIGLAEETGAIDAIGCWVLDTAGRQVATWRERMDHCADLWVSVNLSAFQLPNADSRAAIQAILEDPAVHADHVILEVTESALAAEVDGGVASLNALKGFGVRIAIDDFGTGFSSLSTLASLPVDILKIDRSFVSSGPSTEPAVAMLEGILGLAGKLSLAVIAEGIEEVEQQDLLSHLGCAMGQGYLLGRPSPAEAVEALLAYGGVLGLASALH